MSAALALAFAAGMVATVNPCGFAMLPAYLSYFMGLSDADTTRAGAVRSAFGVGAVVSLGFVAVFGVAGLAITIGLRSLTDWIPWLAVVVGAGVLGLGIVLISGYELALGLPKAKRAGKGRGYRNVFGFGVSYAIASLSCTLPVFLSVVATQLSSRSIVEGLVIFLVYGAGMSVVLMGVTVVLSLGKQSLVNRLRSSAQYINRVSGTILIAAGAFIIWFWTTEIRSGATALGSSPAFRVVENLSQTVLNFVADHTLAVGAAVVVFLVGTAGIATRREREPGEQAENEAGERIPVAAG